MAKCDKCQNPAKIYYMSFQHIPLLYCEIHDPFPNYEEKLKEFDYQNHGVGLLGGYSKKVIEQI